MNANYEMLLGQMIEQLKQLNEKVAHIDKKLEDLDSRLGGKVHELEKSEATRAGAIRAIGVVTTALGAAVVWLTGVATQIWGRP